MLRLLLALAVVVPAVLLQLPAAHAQPARANQAKLKTAKSYVDAGLAAQNAGDYDTAVTLYNKAYELVPHPVLMFNIAQAHRLAGRTDEAEALYRRFLATKPTGPEARLARELLAEIAKRKAEEARKAEQASNAEKPRKTEELRDAEAARKAEQRDEEARRRDEIEKRAEGSPTKLAREETAETAAPQPMQPRPERSPWYRDTIGDLLVLGGIASLTLGGLAYRAARSDLDTAEKLAPDRSTYLELVDSAHSKRLFGVMLGGAGIALIGVGVLRFVMRGPSEPTTVAITPAPSGGLLTLTRSF